MSVPLPATAKDSRYSWNYIIQIVFQHKKSLVIAHFIAILATLVTVPVPLLMPLLVDEVLLHQPGKTLAFINLFCPPQWQTPLIYISIILVLSFILRLFGIVFNVFQTRQFSYMSKEVVFQIRQGLIRHLQVISMSEYENLGTGTVISHLVTDLESLDNFIGTTISKFLMAMLAVIGTGGILLWMHWQLGLFILCLNPLVIYFSKAVGSRVKELKNKENTAYGVFQQALNETLEAIHQIRASNREQYYGERLIASAQKVKEHSTNFIWKSDALSRLSFVIFLFGFDIFRALAMLMTYYSNLTIGEMLAVSGYLWYMMGPVQELLNIQYAFYAAKGALMRLNKLLVLQQEPHYQTLKNPFLKVKSVAIEIDNLHFSYGDKAVLNGIYLKINKGEKVALVGASGGGKSTLAQTLIGLYPATSGTIYFDDVPIQQIGLAVVREHVATVLQHPILFNDTIRANLTLGRIVTDTQLWYALELAQLQELVLSFEKGLDTLVGRQGMTLSGGQRQRLAIARMIVSNPSVVILDEATSALDSETEFKLHQAMQPFLKERTTIIIAHRLSAVKQADHVYVFEEGRICEQGQHAHLLQQQGLYAKLYGQYQT